MIAVDTNILVRYVTNDDPGQARKAMELLAQSDAVLVTHTVLLELAWVLRAAYALDRVSIHRAMLHILGLPNISIAEAERIAQALSWYEQGMDFADALHLALAANVERFVTFDQRFAKVAMERGLSVQSL